jgi:hypothetical protein
MRIFTEIVRLVFSTDVRSILRFTCTADGGLTLKCLAAPAIGLQFESRFVLVIAPWVAVYIRGRSLFKGRFPSLSLSHYM